MKKILLAVFGLYISTAVVKAQCSIQVNDSLLSNYDYVLNAINPVGQAPFQYNWSVTDGNGMTIPFTPTSGGDSIIIDHQVIQNSYGCIIYQLCMTDNVACTTCLQADTSALQVPFNCFSQFNTMIVGPNQVAVTLNSTIPPFLIMQQFLTWTDGNGTGQGMPYFGPGTVVTYTPGSTTTSNQFFLCLMTNLTTGGCISCDSIPYTTLDIADLATSIQLFPNPTAKSIQVQSTEELSEILVYQVDGTVLKTIPCKQATTVTLDLDDLPKGIYFIDIIALNGQQIKQMVIKE